MKPFNALCTVSPTQVISRRTAFVQKGRVKGKTGLLATGKLRFSAHTNMESLSEKEVALAGNQALQLPDSGSQFCL